MPLTWLAETLRHYGIPKILKIIQGLYKNTKCHVIHTFHTRAILQCTYRTTPSSPVIPYLLNSHRLEDENIDDTSLRNPMITHYKAKRPWLRRWCGPPIPSIPAHTTKDIGLYETAKTTGLEINTNKTKPFRVDTQNTAAIMLKINSIDDISNFTCLVSEVSFQNIVAAMRRDIKARLWKVRQVTLRPIWSSRNISIKTKLRIYKTNV